MTTDAIDGRGGISTSTARCAVGYRYQVIADTMRGRLSGALLALGALATAARAQTESDVSIIPRPASITLGQGAFVLTRRTVIWSDPADTGVARRFARELVPATGFHLAVKLGNPTSSGAIVFARGAADDTTLGAEGYHLDVTPSGVTATSANPAGAFY